VEGILTEPVVFGAAYSVYVRIVRLVLEEKGIPYHLHQVDIFATGGPPADYLQRHPFARVPAFEHDEFCLYETGAIVRYIDEAFPGPALQPDNLKARARVNQILSILDNYTYRTLVWDIFVERVDAPRNGRETDEERIAAALPKAEICLSVLEKLMGDNHYLAGPALTLADLHAAPMFDYFCSTPESDRLLENFSGLSRWWERMVGRASMIATQF
jgi:glutathione S-transferase